MGEMKLAGVGPLPSPQHHHSHHAAEIDLSGYDVKHRNFFHFGLALDKTLRLKRRKPLGTLCEVLLPPLFIVGLMVGYLASDTELHPPTDYGQSGMANYNDLLGEALCTQDATAVAAGAFEPCPAEAPPCTSLLPWGFASAKLCLAPNGSASSADAVRYALNAVARNESLGVAIPHFDTMVAMQALSYDNDAVSSSGYTGALKHFGNIEVVGSCANAEAFMEYMNKTTLLFDNLLNRTITRKGSCESGLVWDNEDDAVDYAKGDGAGHTWVVVVLNSVDFTNNQFDYTLRMNYSATPGTNSLSDKFQSGLGQHRGRQYVYSGFATLQETLDGYFMGKPTAAVEGSFLPMPTWQYRSGDFYNAAGGMVPLVLYLAFLFPVSRLVGGIVEEKEQRLREGMLIMGLSKTSFYMSWFASYAILLTISAVFITLLSCVTFLSRTSVLLVFMVNELFVLSLVATSLLVSVFFSKARLASLVAPLLIMALSMPKFALQEDASVATKSVVSLSAPCAFAQGVELMTDYEKRGSGSGFGDFTADDYSYASVVVFILADTVVYLFLAWYLDNVLPSQYGVKRHPLFFLEWIWKKKHPVMQDITPPSRHPHHVDTEFDAATRAALAERERVKIMGLRIEFEDPENKGAKNVAVDNLGNGVVSGAPGGANALTFYEGQVQCVLGHNGAGKTTLINMLTGMLQPTSGDCEIWGRSVRSEMEEIRRDIGLCPQHNILWPRLSCTEHLMFYGRIKGVPTEVLKGRVEQMLRLVNLYEKKDAWSEVLSGGQKRKLSVACALIGGSKLVFLDEPTAGMDVESRRAMWSLLRNPAVLAGRVIVLTTHYMDEADTLGDSVAIMHKGCLHSWGSPFFLKSRLGVGYNMAVSMRAGCNPEAVEGLVRKHIPRAEVQRLSCTGSELRLRLPMDAEPEAEFVAIARDRLGVKYTSPAALRKQLTRILGGAKAPRVNTDNVAGDCEAVLANMRTLAFFPDMFAELEARKDELAVEGFGVGVTTLEEVFMRIATEAHEEDLRDSAAGSAGPIDHLGRPGSGALPVQKAKVHSLPPRTSTGACDHDFGKLYTITDEKDAPIKGQALYMKQFGGMVLKRFRCARRDNRTICMQLVLPVVCVALAIWLGMYSVPKYPALAIDLAALDELPSYVAYQAPAAREGLFTPAHFAGYTLQNITASDPQVTSYAALSAYLLNTTRTRRKSEHRHIAYGFDAEHPVFFANATYSHALPVGITQFNNAVLRTVKQTEDAKIVTRNHPLPFSEYMTKFTDGVRVIVTGYFIMIPFTLIPSNYVSFVVKERECKAKHVQIVSGANLPAYWASSFVFDTIAYCATMVLVFLIFFAADRSEFVGSGETFFASLMLFFLFGVASIAHSYVMSFLFESHTTAKNAVMAFNYVTGFVLVTLTDILDQFDSTKDANEVLEFLFRIVPSYCLGSSIVKLSRRPLVSTILSQPMESPLSMDITGWSMLFLALSCPVYMVLVLFFESPSLRRRVRLAVGCLSFGGSKYTAADEEQPLLTNDQPHTTYDPEEYAKLPRDGENVLYRRGAWLMCRGPDGQTYFFNELTGESRFSDKDTPFYRDANVQRHAQEVLATETGRPGDYVTVKRLRKEWAPRGNAKKKVAVADLSFGVRSGELFAFLGTNGAGKTTTLSVLSGEVEPSSGEAFVAGHNVETDAQLARQNLGFCPQFDALLDHLTCEEHLELFATLRGIPQHHRQPSAEILLEGLGLEPHRKKLASKLSGGNRRKLSVAIALIGGPSAVFLDEPSAGMDPVARRGLWGALEKAITDLHLSVILTTHHLEEIEGLSRLDHRVTIMVDGRLQCLGSLGQLKQQLGDGYELTIKVVSHEAELAVRGFVESRWQTADLVEATQRRLSFQVPKTEASLSEMFRLIEEKRTELGVSDYSINETSLEQVFMRISERALREEDVQAYTADGSGNVQHYLPHPPPSAGLTAAC